MCRRSAGVVACVCGGAGLAIGVDLVWVRQRVVIYAHAGSGWFVVHRWGAVAGRLLVLDLVAHQPTPTPASTHDHPTRHDLFQPPQTVIAYDSPLID